jgi:hypothetical protein
MFRKRTSLCMVLALVAMLAASAPVRAQEGDDTLAPKESGRVILNWKTFQELTKPALADPEKSPKLTLPWSEVQDILGVKVEDPKIAGAELTLNWEQFRALLNWSVAQKEPEKEPVVDLPADFIIASSDVTGILHEKGATFTLKMSLDILKEEGWKRIPLLPATVALEKRTLPDNCYLHVANGHYELLTKAKGKHPIVLNFAVAVTERAGTHSVKFGTVPSGTSTLKLTIAQKDVDIQVAGAQAVLPLDGGADETSVGASLPSGAPVAITWQRALAEVAKVPAKLYAETRTLVLVGEGILTCRETAMVSILHSGVRDVDFTVPKDVSVLEVTGSDVLNWNVTKDGKLNVRFSHEVTGARTVSIVYELAIPKATEADSGKSTCTAPVLSLVGAVREKGYVGVVAQANVEITVAPEAKVTTIDVRQLPADILRMTSQPVLLGFRYIGASREVPLVVQKHADVKVLLTIVDTASATVMQTQDGPRIVQMLYTVRNSRNQFLRVTLPSKEAELWSVSVAGKSVRPARNAAGQVLIPLVRSDAQHLSAFPVELVYVESVAKPGKKGTMSVKLPATDEAVTHMTLKLYLPDEGDYSPGMFGGDKFEGTLRHVEKFTNLRAAAKGRPIDFRANAVRIQEQASQIAQQKARDAGVEPIRVNLPLRGKIFNFEKILVLDKDLWVKFDYSGWNKD